jgi:hypothetical protein
MGTAPGALLAEQFADDFADGVLNPCWTSEGAYGSRTETNGQLVLAKTVNGVGGVGVALDPGVHPVVGDFDVRVDYQLNSFPQPISGARYAGLQATRGSDGFAVATIERHSDSSVVEYKAWTTNSANYASTGDTTGTFRIARSGAVLRMFYWKGDWVQLGSANITDANLYVRLYASTGSGDTGLLNVAFDNVRLVDQYRQGMNRALSLDGSGAFVLVPDSPELRLASTSLTVEAWIRLDKYNTSYNSTLAMKSATTNGGWRIVVQGDGTLGYSLGGGSPFTPRLFSTHRVTTGAWHHVAAVYDSPAQSLKLYIDGTLDGETNAFPAVQFDSDALRIGINNDETAGDWAGLIDEVRIWQKALDETNLVQVMRTRLTGGETGLITCLNFDDGTAADLSGYHNNGAFRGNATTIAEDPLMLDINLILDYLPVEIVEVGFPSGFPLTCYQVEYANSMLTTNWTDLGSACYGNSFRQTLYEEFAGLTQRFYRVTATY